jgi:DnaJ-class molecular chaperone
VDVLKGEGMPLFGSGLYGDMYVEYKVVLPLELSPKIRRSKSLLPSMSRRFLNSFISGLDRVFNEDENGGSGIRDEL